MPPLALGRGGRESSAYSSGLTTTKKIAPPFTPPSLSPSLSGPLPPPEMASLRSRHRAPSLHLTPFPASGSWGTCASSDSTSSPSAACSARSSSSGVPRPHGPSSSAAAAVAVAAALLSSFSAAGFLSPSPPPPSAERRRGVDRGGLLPVVAAAAAAVTAVAGPVGVGVGARVVAGEELLVLVTLRDPGEVLGLLLLLSSPSKLDP